MEPTPHPIRQPVMTPISQFIYVVPELQLVTVITSSCQSSYTPRAYFTDYVLNAYMGA